jgi:hypothetical protein
MSDKLLSNPFLKAKVKKLISVLQVISNGWLQEGVKIGYPTWVKRRVMMNKISFQTV